MSPPFRLRRLISMALVVVALAGVVTLTGPAGANELANKRAEAAAVAARLAELDGVLGEASMRFEEANYQLLLAQEAVAAAQRLSEQTQAEVRQRQQELKGYAVKAYKGGAEGDAPDALLSEDATTGAITQSYLQSLTGNRQDRVDALNAAKLRADEDAARLAKARAEASSVAAQIQVVRDQAQAVRNEQAALNARVQGELAELVRQEQARLRAEEAARRAAERARREAEQQIPINAPPANGSVANTAIRAGLSKVGSRYVWGDEGPNTFDCSGFTLWAFAQAGVRLPHFSGAQYAMTIRISRSQLQPGDLVFWGRGGSSHVAIYMGNDQLVHAFGSGGGVAVTPLEGWWYEPSGYGRLNL